MSQSLLYESHKSLVYHQDKAAPEGPVVIKVLKDKVPDQQEIIRFNNEYEVTRSLAGTAVRKAYNKNKFNNFHALTLEYFEGETLDTCFLKQRRSLSDFLKAAILIASSLEEVHNSNVVHKDINKNNILVNLQKGAVKLIDFGIASRVDLRMQHVGSPQKLEGTLEYISPEQTGRLNKVVDYRTDLYSLGITFYELLTGSLPFLSDNPLELVHCHIAKNPEPPASLKLQLGDGGTLVPRALSAVVMKLISKNAEDRYQSAYGLRCDLEYALAQLQQHGSIPDFDPGRHDRSQKFQVTGKLYGREKDIHTLVAAFERMTRPEEAGATEAVLVTGYSGVGKSSLVEELRFPVSKRRGHFIAGKFDQLFRSVPFYALSQAFAAFVDPLLTEDEQTVSSWREKILAGLEGQGGVLFDMIPNLRLLIGEQPPVPALGGAEAQVRMMYVFRKFVKVIAGEDHPLVLFIDDLQWADLASVDLLKDIILSREIRNFLFIGAYRNNEVSSAHPLMLAVQDIQRGGVTLHSIELGNLSPQNIRQLVADTLLCTPQETDELALLLMEKTKGNAFFINQFLRALYEDKLLAFDPAKRKWHWDMAEIRRREKTDNVVELLTGKISLLEPAAQQLLKLAACTGTVFDAGILAMVAGSPEAEVVSELWAAVSEGLIAPYGGGNTYSVDTLLHSRAKQKKQFRFAHDKIQQAVYMAIPGDEKTKLHLDIGRVLLKGLSDQEKENFVFDLVHQFNIGISLITDAAEKLELARLNDIAGRKAKNSGAYKTALQLLNNGLSLLPASAWQDHYPLALSLHSTATETAFLSGLYGQMESLSEKILQHAKDALDCMPAYDCRIQAYISQNRFPETISTGLEVLKKLGVVFPKNPKGPHIGVALVKTKMALAGKKTEELLHLPEMTDPYKIQAMGILQRMIPAAFMSGSLLFPLIVFRLVNLSLRYGNSPLSAFGYACYAIASVGVLGELDSGYRFGNLSLKLADRFNDDALRSKVGFVYNCFVRHWKAPLRETAGPLLEAYKLGFKSGSVVDGIWAAFYHFIWSYHSGVQLAVLQQKLAGFDEVFRQRDTGAHQMCSLLRQSVENLLAEETAAPWRISGTLYNENEMLAVHKQASDKSSVCIYFLNKIQLCYLFGRYEEAQSNLDDFKSYAEAVTGLGYVPIFNFYESLVALALARNGKGVPARLQGVLRRNQRKMKKWARHAPMNYRHKYLLVEAERQAMSGNSTVAASLFDKAIASAEENEFMQEEALACELAARYYYRLENRFLAEVYMQKAAELYLLWGARSKRRQLLELYPGLLAGTSVQAAAGRTETVRPGKTTTSRNVSELDLATLMKASTSISGEIVLEKLLATLMEIVIENAGAQKGLLLLKRRDTLLVEAERNINDKEAKVLQSVPLSKEILPLSVINYVQRTQEFIVPDDASASPNFANDPYILLHKPKSLLCGPVIDKGKMIGIIYLENNITAKAFTAGRLEMLKLLSGQIAVSIDNALLYENLEQKVAERTAEIRAQKEVIEFQKDELVSSIRYAQRIQRAVLPDEALLKRHFPDSFILFQPKDIVSGDFYWFEQCGDKFIVAAVDCTGHGVPGAFMSMIGSALLNEIIMEQHVLQPAEILTGLHNGIVKSLAQTGTEGGSRDGMDLALVVWDKERGEISFAGANNPLYRVRNGELRIFKANKRPTGYYTSDPEPFRQEVMAAQPGDLFYLFSDGYADQFGGERNKKYTYKRLQEDLLSAHSKPLGEQKEMLLKNFNAWKKDSEQIDDVCVIGLRI